MTKVKSVNFSPVVSLTDNTEATSGHETLESNNASSAGESGSYLKLFKSRRCWAVLSKIYTHIFFLHKTSRRS